jgi:hypothetical protein
MYQCINNQCMLKIVYQCMMKVVYQNEKLCFLGLLEQLHQRVVGHDMTIQVVDEVVL